MLPLFLILSTSIFRPSRISDTPPSSLEQTNSSGPGRRGDRASGRHGDQISNRHDNQVSGRHGDQVSGNVILDIKKLSPTKEEWEKEEYDKSDEGIMARLAANAMNLRKRLSAIKQDAIPLGLKEKNNVGILVSKITGINGVDINLKHAMHMAVICYCIDIHKKKADSWETSDLQIMGILAWLHMNHEARLDKVTGIYLTKEKIDTLKKYYTAESVKNHQYMMILLIPRDFTVQEIKFIEDRPEDNRMTKMDTITTEAKESGFTEFEKILEFYVDKKQTNRPAYIAMLTLFIHDENLEPHVKMELYNFLLAYFQDITDDSDFKGMLNIVFTPLDGEFAWRLLMMFFSQETGTDNRENFLECAHDLIQNAESLQESLRDYCNKLLKGWKDTAEHKNMLHYLIQNLSHRPYIKYYVTEEVDPYDNVKLIISTCCEVYTDQEWMSVRPHLKVLDITLEQTENEFYTIFTREGKDRDPEDVLITLDYTVEDLLETLTVLHQETQKTHLYQRYAFILILFCIYYKEKPNLTSQAVANNYIINLKNERSELIGFIDKVCEKYKYTLSSE